LAIPRCQRNPCEFPVT